MEAGEDWRWTRSSLHPEEAAHGDWRKGGPERTRKGTLEYVTIFLSLCVLCMCVCARLCMNAGARVPWPRYGGQIRGALHVSWCRRQAIWPLGFQSLLFSPPALLQETRYRPWVLRGFQGLYAGPQCSPQRTLPSSHLQAAPPTFSKFSLTM